ncbi:hypothetical protein B1759_14965 [Rubrivirga sp. SAORIC476]|uniref:hypothetical protein n=1 Tax=Rubrivirga sp. SAORIC476 TaxID=1961794 RepID=UPI000BA9CEA3|nr:hypothetical protein [Rubrivirga sp. SAORIC476]PAP79619.1 hypothetical protein B1759_14965 [Rubrivirga sp. SAORIC476]
MTSTAPPLRLAAIARLTSGAGAAALVAAGVASPAAGGVAVDPEQGSDLPYVEVQGATEVETQRSDTTRSVTATLSMVARASTLAGAEAIVQVLVNQLGRRFAVPDDAEGTSATEIQMTAATLDLNGDPFREPPPGARPWGIPIRFRYTLYQPAAPGE